MKSYFLPLIPIALLLSSGCGSAPAPQPPIPAVQDTSDAVSPSSEPTSPFALDVIEDVNDGAQLHVHGQIRSQTAWPIEDLVVRMSGGREGESKTLSFYRLPDLINKGQGAPAGVLEPGKSWDFYLSVPSKDLSDYQLELLWGKEAKAAILTERPTVSAENLGQGLELQNMKVERIVRSCLREPCPSTYRISARLFNGSDKVVQTAQLGVGFLWAPKGQNLDLSGQIPEDEENVNVTGLNLQARQARPLSLDLDKTVPKVEGGEYVPSVRILSFQ